MRPAGAALARRALVLAILVPALVLPAARAAARVPDAFLDQLVVGGMDAPVGMAFLPDGRLLVIEQNSARIRLILNQRIAAPDPLIVVPGVTTEGERGLLGIAVDPDWPLRPYVYVHSTSSIGGGEIRISRFTVSGDLENVDDGLLAISAASRYELIDDLPDVFGNHNGGTVRFGPDGMLYVSLGEDAVQCASQDLSTLRGVILRLDRSRLPSGPGGPPARTLITPPDNPLVDNGDPNAGLIWAWGLRNPFRFHVDPESGDLYIGDVGEGAWEEIDRAGQGGLNFGWPLREGPAPHASDGCVLAGPRVDPIFSLGRAGGGAVAIVSAGLYRPPLGAASPFPAEYDGDCFFGEYYTGILVRLKGSGSSWSIAAPVPGQPEPDRWANGLGQVADYAVGPDGALWYCRQYVDFAPHSGQIRRIVPSATVPDSVPLAVRFELPYPLPAPGYTNLVYDLTRSARVELILYDERGRVVRRLVESAGLSAGRHFETWDGRDDDGRAVRPGLYFARLIVNGTNHDRRVPLIR